jgi:hypothetical protein
MQVHYNLIEEPKPDQTTLKLLMVDKVDRPGKVVLHDRFLMGQFLGEPAKPLQPGLAEAKVTWTATLPGLRYFLGGKPGDKYELFGAYPHMHKLGRKFHFEVKQKGASDGTCGIDLQRWDFNWQRMYYYKKPVAIDDNSEINVSCTFDTRSVTKPVEPGFGTSNEMCLLGMYLVKVN